MDLIPEIPEIPAIDDILKNAGQLLKDNLGLSNIKYVWVQKILNMSYPIYILSYDSRFPGKYLSPVQVKQAEFTKIGKIKRHGISFIQKKVKMTPPIRIEDSLINLQTGYIFILRDFAGEYLRNYSLFEAVVTNEKKSFKEIK